MSHLPSAIWILALQDAWAWSDGHCSMTLSYGAVDEQNTFSSFKHILYFLSISFSIFHSILFVFIVYSTLYNLYSIFHSQFHSICCYSILGLLNLWCKFHSPLISWPCIFYSIGFFPIFYFTVYSTPFFFSYNITYIFSHSTCHQVFISTSLSIPFSPLYSIQFPSCSIFHSISCLSHYSIPHFIPVSTAVSLHFILFCIPFRIHFPFHTVLTLQIPFLSTLRCVSFQLLLQSSKHPIPFGWSCFNSDFQENILLIFWSKNYKCAWPVPRIASSGSLSTARTQLKIWTIFSKKDVPHSDVL